MVNVPALMAVGDWAAMMQRRHRQRQDASHRTSSSPTKVPSNALGDSGANNDERVTLLPLRRRTDSSSSPSSSGRKHRWCRCRCNSYHDHVRRVPLYVVAAFVSVLTFGTVYTDLTARDPCEVMRTSTRARPDLSSGFPRFFHYQSKVDDSLTDETRTWFDLLGMDESRRRTYPDIGPSSHRSEKGEAGDGDKDDEWTAVYWSDESCHALVRERFPDFLHVYESFTHTIQRVDSCRYMILSTYGGIYADTDVSLHSEKILEVIPDDAEDEDGGDAGGVGLVESPYRYNEGVQNSLMTSASAGHPFWDTVLEVVSERGGSDAVLSSTGPKMLDDAMLRYREKGGTTAGVNVLPCELFQRIPLGHWRDTTFANVLGREIVSRAVPMRGCGRYGAEGTCEITRHGGRASWTKDSGRMT